MFDHQIDFGTICRAPKKELSVGMPQSFTPNNILKHESLPTGSKYGMVANIIERVQIQQVMQQSRVSQIDLRRFDQPFAHIAKIGLQTSDHECLFKNIQIPADGVVRNSERCTQR